MKPITRNRTTTIEPGKTPPVVQERTVQAAPEKAQAQCCAKVSGPSMGCHD
jgi:hypothetical protein